MSIVIGGLRQQGLSVVKANDPYVNICAHILSYLDCSDFCTSSDDCFSNECCALFICVSRSSFGACFADDIKNAIVAAGNYLVAGFDHLGNLITQGLDAAGNAIGSAANQAWQVRLVPYDVDNSPTACLQCCITNFLS